MAGATRPSYYGSPSITSPSNVSVPYAAQGVSTRRTVAPPPARKDDADYRSSWLTGDMTLAQIEALKKRGVMDERRQDFDMSHIDRTFGLTKATTDQQLEMGKKRAGLTDSISALLLGEFGGGGKPGGAPTIGAGGSVVEPGAMPGAPPAAVGADAAADAGYARLKEREGQRLRGNINTAKRDLGRRGLSGSSFESPAIAALIGDSSGRLADFDAGAMADSVSRARQVEDRDVQRGDRRFEFESGQRDNRMDMLLKLLGVAGSAY